MSSEGSISDYPTHSRKLLTVVNQEGLQSQMPEHVTVPESPPAGYPIATHTRSLPRERVRTRHMYEQIELPIDEESGPPYHSDMHMRPPEVDSLVNSVKRNNRWSPGISKHHIKQDQAHAKVMKEASERPGSGGRRRSLVKKNSTGSMMPAASGLVGTPDAPQRLQMARSMPTGGDSGDRTAQEVSWQLMQLYCYSYTAVSHKYFIIACFIIIIVIKLSPYLSKYL